jgi:hypothetical protein
VTLDSDSLPLPRWRQVLGRIPAAVVVGASLIMAVLILVLPIFPGEQTVSLKLGDVSTQDVQIGRASCRERV